MKKIIITTLSLIFLVACSNSGGVEQVSLDEMEEILDSGNEYILIYRETNDNYVHDVEKVSEEKGKEIKMYNIHEKNGDSNNNDSGWIKPETQYVDEHSLYQVEDGKLVQELILTDYEGTDRVKEIEKVLK